MVGGGGFGWEPGEWTDDTSMAIAIAEVAATGADLREEAALNGVVRRWHSWMQTAKDIGVQTSQVLRTSGWFGLGAQSARSPPQPVPSGARRYGRPTATTTRALTCPPC
jgi:ADP-ribosyl-[dinitrogen reductase] hydrolase